MQSHLRATLQSVAFVIVGDHIFHHIPFCSCVFYWKTCSLPLWDSAAGSVLTPGNGKAYLSAGLEQTLNQRTDASRVLSTVCTVHQ